MASYLTRRQTVAEIEDLIRSPDANLFLISAYLNICEDFKKLIEERSESGRKTVIIYGKKEWLDYNLYTWLKSLSGVSLHFCKESHAKCYMNDSKAIITSMNLVEFSQNNNFEMGVLVTKKDEPELFNEIGREVEYLLKKHCSSKFEEETPRREGYCIRCGEPVPFNPDKPYCLKCYSTWSDFYNEDYEEKFCHSCKKRQKPVSRNLSVKNVSEGNLTPDLRLSHEFFLKMHLL